MPNENNIEENDISIPGLNLDESDTTGTLSFDDVNAPVEGDYDDEPLVYGLQSNKEEYEARKNRIATLRFVLLGILAAVLLIAGLMVIKPFNLGKSDGPRTEPVVAREDEEAEAAEDEEAAAEEEEEAESSEKEEEKEEKSSEEEKKEESESSENEEKEEKAEPEPEPEQASEEKSEFSLPLIPTAADIEEAARQLSFNGEDLSLADADLTVEVLKGRVQVTHVLHDLSTVEPNLVAGNAARRCAALTNMLTGHDVQGKGEQEASPFVDCIWIVRNTNGDSFLAVSYPAGKAPTEGDGLVVLTQSPRYRLSDSMYQALGRTVQQEMGETPVTLDNVYIWSTASF